MKRQIRLTESELHRLVESTVRNILREGFEDTNTYDVYTMDKWNSDGDLKVKEGQFVDNEVIEQLVNNFPPAFYGTSYKHGVTAFQTGEPYDFDQNSLKDLYQTFFYDKGKKIWKYVGLMPHL